MNGPPSGAALTSAALRFVLAHRGRELECRVTGGSMLPAMPDGSRVRLALGTPDALAAGEVVGVLLGGDMLTVHRLVHVGRSDRARGWALTSGDGNLICDVPVPWSRIAGRVVAWSPPGDAGWSKRCPVVDASAVSRRATARLLTALFRWSLEIHPTLGLMVRDLVLLHRSAVVALRPYPGGTRRTVSRFALGGRRGRVDGPRGEP